MRLRTLCVLLLTLLITPFGVTQKKVTTPYKVTIKASFYHDKFEGRKTANGEVYWHNKLTAAHLTLPFNTWLRVTNVKTGQSVVVKVNDRGPFSDKYTLDLSVSAARAVGITQKMGWATVNVESIGRGKQQP